MGNSPTKEEQPTAGITVPVFCVQRMSKGLGLGLVQDVFSVRVTRDHKFEVVYTLIQQDKDQKKKKGDLIDTKLVIPDIETLREYIKGTCLSFLGYDKQKRSFTVCAAPSPVFSIMTDDHAVLQSCLDQQLNCWLRVNYIPAGATATAPASAVDEDVPAKI